MMSPSASWAIVLRQPSNNDELFMQQTLLFSETLRDLKNLRKQLYSAAEYFEASYGKDDEKEMVIETLKEYALKATVNTVDHLGSVADKFNGFLDEKMSDMFGTELRLSCIEQRMNSCKEYVNRSGMYQQLLLIDTPRHHKRYIFPDGDARDSGSEFQYKSFNSEEGPQGLGDAIRATIRETPNRQSLQGKQYQRFRSVPGTLSFTSIPPNRTAEKRSISPLLRSGSLLKRSISPSNSRKQEQALETRRSIQVTKNDGRERRTTDIERYSSKSKGMFKALLSMRRSQKDGALH